MKLGYELTIEQQQKLIMTPELIQAIQILQYNAQELDTYVADQLLSNPVLEQSAEIPDDGEEDTSIANQEDEINSEQKGDLEGKEDSEDGSLMEYIRLRGADDISYRQGDYNKEEKSNGYEQFVTSDVSLHEHLMFQLQFASHNKICRRIGKYVIECLDDNGYLTSTVSEIARVLNTSTKDVEKVVELVQTFEPAGVGADCLGKCLLIQLESQGLRDSSYEKLLMEHIEDLAANRLNIIAKALGYTVLEVQKMRDLIKGLDPRPGAQFSKQAEVRYITPDVLVKKVEDEYVVSINNDSVPRLMVSSYYRQVLSKAGKDDKLTEYLSDRLNSAMWLIKSIEQRKQTILNVVRSIVEFQHQFFEYGDKYLKTLTLKQVAEELGIHESTVSRSINGKYMESPRGVFELKYFFSGGVQGEMGEGISSNSIKTHIKEILQTENPKAPYSDQEMVRRLASRGIDISRRTVAKYRDEMNILSSSKRKRY